MMKDVHVKAEEALDVTSLFTNVPIDEAVDVIHRGGPRYQQRASQSSFSSV